MGEVLLGVPAFHTILRFVLLGRFKTTSTDAGDITVSPQLGLLEPIATG